MGVRTRRRPGARRGLTRVLVVYWWPDELEMRVAVEQHLHALDSTGAELVYVNSYRTAPRSLAFERWDLVVLHTTFLCMRWDPSFKAFRRRWSWIGRLGCAKVALPQDEYDHAETLDEWLADFRVDSVYSMFDAPAREVLYPGRAAGARFEQALTGYVDAAAVSYCEERARPVAERPLDVVYRALQLPFWFGSHGQLKHEIGLEAARLSARIGLRHDISTDPADTILGTRWLDFMMSGRAVVGAESGSSVLDRRGEIRTRIQALLAADPTHDFEQISRKMPAGWDDYRFFALSPRHLEAVLSRTLQILVEGSYSGVLVPERHFIPVKRDLSNLEAALERVRDDRLVSELTEAAYEDIVGGGRWTTARLGQRVIGEARPARSSSATLRMRRGAAAVLRRAEASPVAVPRLPEARLAAFASASEGRLAAARAALGAVARRPRLGSCIVRGLVERRVVEPRAVGRDLLRLGTMDRFVRHQAAIGGRWTASVEVVDSSVVIRTRRVGDTDGAELPARTPPAASVIWDHSEVSRTVHIDPSHPARGEITLGRNGVYEFDALSTLVRRFPNQAWSTLLEPRA